MRAYRRFVAGILAIAGVSVAAVWAAGAGVAATALCALALLGLVALAARHAHREAVARIALEETAAHHAAGERRWRSMTEAIAQAIVTIGPDGTVEAVNPAAERMFGLRADEIVGRNVSMLMPEPFAREHDGHIRAFGQSGRAHPVESIRELTGRRADGSAFPMEIALAGWRDGGRALVIGAIRDITTHKRIQETLRHARDAADRASQAKTDLLAAMSHDIRAPMDSLLGALADLEAPGADDGRGRLIGMARRSAVALLRIIDNGFDLSRLEAGGLEIEPAEFDPRAVVADAVARLSSVARDKGLVLDWSAEPGVPERVWSDPGRLRRILETLLDDALTSIPAGRVSVRLAAEPAAPGDGTAAPRLRFDVMSTGSGIPADPAARPFQPLGLGDGDGGGSRLGLAVCRELSRLLGGEITANGVAGQGGVFRATIACTPATPRPAAAVTRPPAGGPLRVLVAEDNDVNRTIVTAVLERAGHAVTAVTDGAQAVAAAAGGGFDAILMDIQMPVMDGPTATRRIRALGGTAGAVPIVALTASPADGGRETYIAAGMTGCLTKPIDPSGLLATLAEVTQPPDAADPLLDPVQIDALFDAVGAEAWTGAVDTFVDNARDLIAAIRAATRPGSVDAGAQRLAAHTLKGAAGSVGAARLARLAARIETMDPAGAVAVVPVLDRLLGETVEAMRRGAPWATDSPRGP